MAADAGDVDIRVVTEMRNKTFEACTLLLDATDVTSQLQQLAKNKQEVKDKFHKTLTVNTFMRHLATPIDTWDTIITRTDEELQTARSSLREARHRMEDQKTKLMQWNSVAAEALAFYQQNVNSLEEQLQCLEKLTQDLQMLQQSVSDTDAEDENLGTLLQTQVDQCHGEMQECRRQLLAMEHSKTQILMRVSHMEDDLQQLRMTLNTDQERMDAQCLSRLQKSISNMEALSGVTCKVHNFNTIVVEFPPRQSASPSTSHSDDLVLQVTLTFRENSMGSLRLTDVQSNMDSFDVSEVWRRGEDDAKGGVDSLPSLIHVIKQRWFSHRPLLAEINRLRSRSAIDWIQQDNVLRVIVGKGGGIVCSLDIPPHYPHHGHVTLANILGATQSMDLQDLKPSTGSRLEDWVCFLEDIFGKP